jgi:DHA2 family multidrug resistance protein
MAERLSSIKNAMISKGYDAFTATDMSYKALDGAVTQQAYLLSYLDGFRVISLFFLCAIPAMFLLKFKKLNAGEMAKVAEESH